MTLPLELRIETLPYKLDMLLTRDDLLLILNALEAYQDSDIHESWADLAGDLRGDLLRRFGL